MGDDFRRMECCQKECQDKCVKDCYCKDEGAGNGIWLIILIIVIYCLFCNDNKGGGFLGGLF